MNTKKRNSFSHIQDESLQKTWLHGRSVSTIKAYKRISDDLLANLHPKSLKDADLLFLQLFIDVQKCKKPQTLKQRVAVIRSLFSFAHRSGYLSVNPATFLPQVKSSQKLAERYLTEEEVMTMIARTEDVRDRTILKILYGGGLRVSELCNLKWKDISKRDSGEGQIQIEAGKGEKLRVIVVTKATNDDLILLKKPVNYDHCFVFQSQKNKSLSSNRVREIVTAAKLRAGIKQKVSPHWLRHCHASHALDRGAPIHLVQSTLGHTSVATTGKYLHSRPQESSSKYLGI